ncbi:MAG: hypothetical protein AAFW95_07230 [Cyanobacteria bacterium J06638_6]
MQPNMRFDVKWHRLVIAVLVTLIMADTAPHPQLSPGLLQLLTVRVMTQVERR